MKISVRSVHFDADSKLIDYVERKTQHLNRFFDGIVEAEVYLRLQHTGGKIQQKIAEVRLNLPGGTLFDKSTSSSFESALNGSINSLTRQVKRFKEKRKSRGIKDLD